MIGEFEDRSNDYGMIYRTTERKGVSTDGEDGEDAKLRSQLYLLEPRERHLCTMCPSPLWVSSAL